MAPRSKKQAEKAPAKIIKLQIPAGEAKPDPPVGPALGQHGVNIGDFIKRFNAATAQQERGLLLPVIISIQADRSFDFVIKKPPAAILIKRALGIAKGSGKPPVDQVGKLTRSQLREIAQEKLEELNTTDVEQGMLTIAGTARSMGVEVGQEA